MGNQIKISDIGEDGLLELVRAKFGTRTPEDVVGIGDDCAIIPASADDLVLTTDTLAEGVHFLRSFGSSFDLGCKAMAVNLSDIAAMGASPRYALVSLSLPSDLELGWVTDLLSGIASSSVEYGLVVIGGNLNRSQSGCVISITIVGAQVGTAPRLRSAAREGDFLCLTGVVGDSRAGLMLLQEASSAENRANAELVRQHLRPRAHIREGQFLASQSAVHAMMDVSDGLARDLPRLAQSSNLAAKVFLEKVPLSEQLLRFANSRNIEPSRFAYTGGEDYVLALSVAPQSYSSLAADFENKFKQSLFHVGEFVIGSGVTILRNGIEESLDDRGFEHFGQG